MICECGTIDHQFVLLYDPEYREMTMAVHLSSKSFWKRFQHAVKYLFGYRSRYGDFDEIILDQIKLKELQDFLSQSLKE